ncbi:hypothetical protein LA080_014783 [Diaporthe eres]|nr:hypothetical protein LA080_014783 [Diaporthe eres]
MTLGVGDIFAIIDKAWALYEILRDSRSSNTQYRDLQNQLRSLYEVLLSVKEVQEAGRLEARPGAEVFTTDDLKHGYSLVSCIASIDQNCGETLDQLYEIFDKHRILGVAKKEKEIQFTTEKEDLDSLRIQVQLHTNSLGVLLNLVINSQASRIETQTSYIASRTTSIEAQNRKVSKLLEEIHTAWLHDLKVSQGNSTAAPGGPRLDSTDALFSIFEEDKPSSFQELCGLNFSNHRLAIEAYASRRAGDERTWIIYNVLETFTNRKVTLRLTNIKLKYMAIFEDSMTDLAAQAIPVMLQRGPESNYLVDRSSQSREVSVLGIHSGFCGLVPQVERYDNILTPEASPAHEDMLRLPDKKAGDSASIVPHDSIGMFSQPPVALLARRPQGYFDINISQEVMPDFFRQAKETGKMNFASLAHVVQIENTGVRTLTPHEQGLQHLRFERGKDGTNMLEIACNTLLIGD